MTYKLSPRRVNLFMECERCFWLHINEGVKRPSGPFPSLPGGMDEMIKTHFDKFRERGHQPPELRESRVDAVPIDDTQFLEDVREWQNEPKYHDEENDVLLRGGVDDLLQTSDGSIIVLDYKTRGYPPKTKYQTTMPARSISTASYSARADTPPPTTDYSPTTTTTPTKSRKPAKSCSKTR
jgi:hypothetical protein